MKGLYLKIGLVCITFINTPELYAKQIVASDDKGKAYYTPEEVRALWGLSIVRRRLSVVR